eukprot:281840-Chlamydomonas_euryale.AAC.1
MSQSQSYRDSGMHRTLACTGLWHVQDSGMHWHDSGMHRTLACTTCLPVHHARRAPLLARMHDMAGFQPCTPLVAPHA